MATNAFSDLTRLINGYQISQAIHVAARLGIADHRSIGCCGHWLQPVFSMRRRTERSRSPQWASVFVPTRPLHSTAGPPMSAAPMPGRPGAILNTAFAPARVPFGISMVRAYGSIAAPVQMRTRSSTEP